MLQVLIGIVVIALVVAGGLYLFQRRAINRVNELQAQKQALVAKHIEGKISDGDQLSLTGDSLEQFEKLKHDFEQVQQQLFPKIDALIEAIRSDARGINFILTNQKLAELTDLVQQATDQIHTDQQSLQELQKIDQTHRHAVSELEKKYQQIRKKLLSENFRFGNSIDQLEDRLSKLEDAFDQFSQLTIEGDHSNAHDVLLELRAQTSELDKIIAAVPDLYQKLDLTYPKQLKELARGYQKLAQQDYQFVDADIAMEIDNINKQRKETLGKLAQLEIDAVQKANTSIERQVDHLYDVMQKEIDARPEVTKLMPEISKFIIHAQNQNHELLIELDRLSQNYTLDHAELETTRGLGEQIKAIEKDYQDDMSAIHKHTAIDSQILERQKAANEKLVQIELQQTEVNDSVAGLQEDEQKAKETLAHFATEIHAIKRQVELLNLPGLPKEYLDYFFVVSDEITKLDEDINRIKINMEEITKQLLIVQADLETLQEKTDDIRDSSQLTERLLQYANRFRENHPDVDEAAQKSQQLFDQDFDYSASLETIATVLDKVEPGSYKRLESSYYDSIEQNK